MRAGRPALLSFDVKCGEHGYETAVISVGNLVTMLSFDTQRGRLEV